MGQRLVVIGGDAGGMVAASVARRRSPDLEIVALERGPWTSYSACGIPYLVAGTVPTVDDLVARTPEAFRAQRIDVRINHEATAIDLDAGQVEVHNQVHDRTFKLGFDLLHIATGAVPNRPDIPGIDADHVHGVQTLGDATRLRDAYERDRPDHVVVIGSGYIGLELAESFLTRGARVTVVDQAAEVMGALDPDMGALVTRSLRDHGVTVRLGEKLVAVEGDSVVTTGGPVRADLVILGLGVRPDSRLAAAGGIDTGPAGGIVVDRRQRASRAGRHLAHVWAAGDCCQTVNVVSGRPGQQALGTVANKQGLVAGINIAGGYATFPGAAGTAVTRLCATEIGRTGLSEKEATEAGFDYVVARVQATNLSGYLPGAVGVTVKLLAERGRGRLLGAQIVGGPGSAKRVDAVAVAVTAGMEVEDLVMADLGYAPPFSSVWDPVQVAARQAMAQLRATADAWPAGPAARSGK